VGSFKNYCEINSLMSQIALIDYIDLSGKHIIIIIIIIIIKKRVTIWSCKQKINLHRRYTRVYPKVSGLASWSENCKWYSSLPLGAVVSLFCVSV
jgi:hypothetical protein